MKNDRAGRCYQLAAERLLEGRTPAGATLVHGYPTLAGGEHQGSRYGHAWLEWPVGPLWMCWDPVTDTEILGPLYYAAGRIDPELCDRYTRASMREHLVEIGTWGPWEDPPPDALFGK